jgi:transposase
MEAFTKRERRKIIARYQQGWDTVDIAQHFGASESGVRRVWQQFREQGRDEPAFDNCGRKPTLTAEQLRQVRQIAEQRPDAFLHELAEVIVERLGVRACRQTVGRWLRDLGITRKKSRCTPRNSSARTSRRNARPGPGRSPTPVPATTPA